MYSQLLLIWLGDYYRTVTAASDLINCKNVHSKKLTPDILAPNPNLRFKPRLRTSFVATDPQTNTTFEQQAD